MPTIIGTGQMTLTDLNDVIASATAPTNPIDGALWWNTTENKLYVYSNGQWVFSSDGMIFGGVNLLRNSTFGATTNGTTLKNWNSTVSMTTPNDFLGSTSLKLTRTNWATGNPRVQISQSLTLIPFPQKGYQYTFSGWVYVDSSVVMEGTQSDIAVRIVKAVAGSDGTTMRDYRVVDLTTLEKNKWVYVSKTLTLLEDINKIEMLFSLQQNGLIKIARPQLETGNIASNWSPAPEDGEETISEIQKTLNNLADDSILDYNERQIIKDKLTELTGMVIPNGNTAMPDIGYIDAESNSAKGLVYNVRKQAKQMAISIDDQKYKAVETTYNALRTYLGAMTPKPWNVDPAIKDQIITVANKDTFRSTWLNLYLAINDLASYTVEKAKEATDNTGVIANGGDNYISNGDFRLDITKSLWKANYYGDVKEIVDISAQAPPHQFALHIKNNSAKNGGIFQPVIWDANIAEAMINRDVTISFWLKYSGITQGAQNYMAGRFGELIIEGAKADGTVASTKYVRFSNPTTIGESAYITGTNTTWVKYSATVKITPHATASKITRISFKHGIEACVGEFWTTGIKLEIGNKETPWSESPVDIYDRIGKAELAVKPESIVATVTGSSQYKTDIQGAKDYARDEAKAQLDKIVSMKNLLLDSQKNYSTTDYLVNQYMLTENFVTGQKYTFVIKGTVPAGQRFGIWQNGGSTNVGYADTTFYNGVTYVTFTAQATTAGHERTLRLYNAPQNTTVATVDWVALYKGEKPLDWIASPEDLNIESRNLLMGSMDYNTDGWVFQSSIKLGETYKGTAIAEASTDWASLDYKVSDLVSRGVVAVDDTLTFACSARLVGGTTETKNLRFFLAGADTNNTVVGVVGKDWQTFFVTFTMNQSIITQNQVMRFEVDTINNTPLKLQVSQMRLVKGDKPLDWQPAPEDVYINYGNKNLILNSEFKAGFNNWIANPGGTTWTAIETGILPDQSNHVITNIKGTTAIYQDFTQYIEVEPSTTYTFSFNGGGTFQTFLWEKKADKNPTAVYKDNVKTYTGMAWDMSWSRNNFTQTITTQPDTKIIQLIFRVQVANTNGTTYTGGRFGRPKLEKGNIATAWSPNPLDYIDNLASNQTTGRNLLRNTGYVFNQDNWYLNNASWASPAIINESTALSGKALQVNFTGTVSGGTHNRPVIIPEIGETYSWSIYVKASRNCKVKIGHEMYGTIDADVTTSWQKFTYTFIARPYVNTSFVIYYTQDGGANGSLFIHSAQFEKGLKTSALWTPAPEDYDKQLSALATRMDTAELKITDSAIVATVTKSTEFKGKADANTVYTKDEIANMGTPQLLHNTEWNSDSKWWTVNSGWSLDFTKRFEGVTSFKCVVTGQATNAYPAIFSEFINTQQGQTFIASGFTYTDNRNSFDQGGSIEIEWYNSSNTRISTSSATLVPSANGIWERKSVSGTAPANTVKARIRFHPIRNGSFWVAKPMLQYGNMLTAWSPSIDELATDLTSQITQTAGRIELVVGSDNKIKGEAIASAITMTPNAINMISNSINLTGKVTFNSLASSLQTDLNNYDSTRSKLETMTNGTTYINGGYIRSGTISGVTINVDTDLQVGKEIRLGSMTDFSLKMLRFNNSANISTTNGDIMNISSNITRIADGSVIIGNTMNTDVYTTTLQGAVNVSGVTKWIGGVPAVFG
ncbi:tail fiber [Bacillus phage vB_BanS-Thrax2]|nr:tail fiber [Bacillus phage vB_BanS-Thrax2]